jgi:hypothetical protein
MKVYWPARCLCPYCLLVFRQLQVNFQQTGTEENLLHPLFHHFISHTVDALSTKSPVMSNLSGIIALNPHSSEAIPFSGKHYCLIMYVVDVRRKSPLARTCVSYLEGRTLLFISHVQPQHKDAHVFVSSLWTKVDKTHVHFPLNRSNGIDSCSGYETQAHTFEKTRPRPHAVPRLQHMQYGPRSCSAVLKRVLLKRPQLKF